MSEAYPFIYIASLLRTGSTLISETLTKLPDAFIFVEPDLGKNTFHLRSGVNEAFLARGQDLQQFIETRARIAYVLRGLRRVGFPQDYMIREFKEKLLPKLGGKATQFGVKEVHNRGWQNYQRHFPNMKVILTGRDPRDIYISLYYSKKRGMFARASLVPEAFAAAQNAEFALQKAIAHRTDHLKLRYEDVCTEPTYLKDLKAFVHSPLLETDVPVGLFIGLHPQRESEHKTHGNKVTAQQVERWKQEKDEKLVLQAQQVFDLMPEYTQYWQYEK